MHGSSGWDVSLLPRRLLLMVATGAGIGPVLPYLLDRTSVQFECLWIGRRHHAAMGPGLADRVLASGRVTLIDTSEGRPDVGERVAAVARRFEAVFVVSNDAVRDSVARACQVLGVPWYGPTFDSLPYRRRRDGGHGDAGGSGGRGQRR